MVRECTYLPMLYNLTIISAHAAAVVTTGFNGYINGYLVIQVVVQWLIAPHGPTRNIYTTRKMRTSANFLCTVTHRNRMVYILELKWFHGFRDEMQKLFVS